MVIRKITPPCPVCKSEKTGYFLPACYNFSQVKTDHFQKGEYVRPYPSVIGNYNNCFCVECGYNYKGKIKYRILSKDNYIQYLSARGFIEKRNQLMKERKRYSKKKKEKKKKLSKAEIYDIFSIILLIVCGIDIRRKKEKQSD